jgi:hypothetical protein
MKSKSRRSFIKAKDRLATSVPVVILKEVQMGDYRLVISQIEGYDPYTKLVCK